MSDERDRVIADETAVEREYRDELEKKARKSQALLNSTISNTLTTSLISDAPRDGEFVGRIALEGPNEDLDGAHEFYIGSARLDDEGYQVYSWVTPLAACTYYRQIADREVLEGIHDAVVGMRSFGHRAGKIFDYQDEALGELDPDSLFPKRVLAIPRAPTGTRLPRAAVPETDPIGAAPKRDSVSPTEAPVRAPTAPVPGPRVRAPELLQRQLSSPKARSMSAVLATLQPDQYEVIAKPAAESQVLQGHPGTGKTIIAAHRAAYMLNPVAPKGAAPRGNVLIIGPTDEYVDHIKNALSKLIDGSDRYVVTSMPALLENVADLPLSTVPTQSVDYTDVSPELASLIELAHSRARVGLELGARPSRSQVYEHLVGLLQDPPNAGLEPEWVTYLRGLPRSYEEIHRQRVSTRRGLLAYIGALTTRSTLNPGHIIVDEGQDIHPIEWKVLGRLGNTGGWTILGDLNQRRTDHTFSTWDEVAEILAIENDSGKAPLMVLERGYRSTAPIIRFANQLLRAQDRTLYSLQQSGEIPTVVHEPSPAKLLDTALLELDRLLTKVSEGSVAIITTDPSRFTNALVKKGWTAEPGDRSMWRHEDRFVRVLPPERARGLEFDGVLVVEPATFPENVGRQGVLYTALTRANRFLSVVHNRALPAGMRSRP